MRTAFLVSVLAIAACCSLRAQGDAPDVGIDAGICVVVPAVDSESLAALTKQGRMLVQGLALDDARRDQIRAGLVKGGVQGLATVVTWPERGRLSYADNLATVLVVDVDALGKDAPSKDEMDRVLAPFGKLCVKRGGQWSIAAKARPKEMDDWRHFDGDAAGNAVSADTLVGPPRLPQWITGIQGNPFEGNPAGYSPGGGLRVAGRYAVLDVDAGLDVKGKRVGKTDLILQCRDAFNGMPQWSLPRDASVAKRRWSLVADDGRIFTYLRADGDLTSIDAATGKTLTTFPGTAPENPMNPAKAASLLEETTCVRVAGDVLVVTHNDRLLCFDSKTGKPRWTYRREGKQILAPSLDAAAGRVYCFVSTLKERGAFGLRWPFSTAVEAVVAVDLKSGERIWENTDVASKKLAPDAKGKTATRGPGQLLPVDKYVVVFGSCAIGGGEAPFLASLDRDSGKLLHIDDHPLNISYNSTVYNALAKGGKVYLAGAFFNFWRYDPATGTTDKVLSASFNQRCTRLTATGRFFLFGQAAYWDDQFAGEQVCAARSGCSIGNIPANGLTYFTPNACECITQMRGFQALSSEKLGAAIPDADRLRPGRAAVTFPAPAASPAGPIAEEWTRHWRLAQKETEPVQAGDLALVANVHGHILEARRGDQVVWRVVADGRVSSPPVVVGDVAAFGAHDGWVYAIALKDGALRWKHLVAPQHRWWQAYGQLESTWPVYGVALDRGKIIASAGTHVELGGGVTVVSLAADSGKADWRKTIRKTPATIPAGGKGAKIVGRSFLNGAPRLEDGRIVLGDGGRVGGRFEFDVDESEADAERRLSTSPKKK